MALEVGGDLPEAMTCRYVHRRERSFTQDTVDLEPVACLEAGNGAGQRVVVHSLRRRAIDRARIRAHRDRSGARRVSDGDSCRRQSPAHRRETPGVLTVPGREHAAWGHCGPTAGRDDRTQSHELAAEGSVVLVRRAHAGDRRVERLLAQGPRNRIVESLPAQVDVPRL